MKQAVAIAFLICSLCYTNPVFGAHSQQEEVTISVQSSPSASYVTSVTIQSRPFVKGIADARQSDGKGVGTWAADVTLTLKRGDHTLSWIVDEDGTLLDLEKQKRLHPSPPVQRKLQVIADQLRIKHYGDLTAWPEVDTVLPKKARFQIVDLETGLTFRVQRRAGDQHADVQPLTREDTKTFKKIYNGKWSWNRRAVLVKTDDRVIAASMNGMPHGRGSLRNGFPGHFCVHFYGSTTHRSQHVDLLHHLMIYKAAGRLDDYFRQLSPFDLIDVFIATFNLHDRHTLNMTLAEFGRSHNRVVDTLDGIVSITRHAPFAQGHVSAQLAADIPVTVRLYRPGGDERAVFRFLVTRDVLEQRWEISDVQRDQ